MDVELTKINVAEEASVESATKEEYEPYLGKGNSPKSLFVGYTIKGSMYNNVEVGQPIEIWRNERNGVKIQGFFKSSNVNSITPLRDGFEIETDNSLYFLKEI